MAAGQFLGLVEEGREEWSYQVVGQLKENGLSLETVVLPSVRLHHNGQSGGSAQVHILQRPPSSRDGCYRKPRTAFLIWSSSNPISAMRHDSNSFVSFWLIG